MSQKQARAKRLARSLSDPTRRQDVGSIIAHMTVPAHMKGHKIPNIIRAVRHILPAYERELKHLADSVPTS